MDPETLVTFLFRAPPHIRTVELLGSWDNFTHTYRMHHDRRRGTGFWSGCFKFENIVFDGDSPKPNWSRPRSGGLKQGGTYWYYYRLDFDIEAYDDSRRCTADCPLMPGQMMNMIEVPTEMLSPPSRCRSACGEGIAGTLAAMTSMRPRQTLEPGDKFAALRPPPVSKVHGRCISDMALNGRLERPAVSRRSSIISPPASRDREEATGESPDDRPSKRRRSSDRKASQCTVSTHAEQSCRYGSIVDGYATKLPLVEAVHPNPLASSPVNQDVRNELQRGLHQFNFGFGEKAIAKQEARDQSPSSPCARRDSVSSYDSRGSSSPSSTRSCPAQQQTWCSSHNAVDTHAADDGTTMSPDPSLPLSHEIEPSSDSGEELWSPTFSADTVSSNGGLDTPFRLSGGYSHGMEGSSPEDLDHNTQNMNDVTERLKTLDTSTKAESLANLGLLPEQPALELAGLDSCIFPLPPPAAAAAAPGRAQTDTNLSRKLFDPPIALHHAGLPSLGFDFSRKAATEAASSLTLSVTNMEDLFSELGYLGGCIN
ncbi:hypothetical protein LTR78_001142 [Recurvomyces mirabilis]|uniref:Uncharacterized protein n=1 Tax=Recurvomyces mirabilis TaxID=574656 RepID=A0AAE1C5B3_9PEZI|nr:hypothetical protein LTR78_001142 [Recurvomyces mirabilis]KAK5161118.1 hypothetical protein LTS14_000914 [Recurvomyces mirabilis]